MANALLHRYSPTLFQLEDAARQYRGMTLLELARESLGNAGVNTRGLSRDEVATRALHSTSDFPEILSAVTNKTLRQAYEAYPRTFMLFCRQVLATDFKAMHRVQLGEAPQLLEVGESGEFKRGTLGESKESYKVKTYGRVVAITRQTLINDDLDAFTRIPAMYGNSIAQLESDVVWGVITSNPAMADGSALFHANHKNLAGTGAALAVDAVGAARAAMAKQTGLDKKTVLNVRPAFLIVPASLELKGRAAGRPEPRARRDRERGAAVDPHTGADQRAAARCGQRNRLGIWRPIRTRSTRSSTPISKVSRALTSRRATASTSTASRSSAAWTSAPRPSTGAASTRTRAHRPGHP